jgi:hypothetical protein
MKPNDKENTSESDGMSDLPDIEEMLNSLQDILEQWTRD